MYVRFLIFGGRKLLVATIRLQLVYGSRKREYLEVEVCKVHEIVVDGK
jgi:hypothetical protein